LTFGTACEPEHLIAGGGVAIGVEPRGGVCADRGRRGHRKGKIRAIAAGIDCVADTEATVDPVAGGPVVQSAINDHRSCVRHS